MVNVALLLLVIMMAMEVPPVPPPEESTTVAMVVGKVGPAVVMPITTIIMAMTGGSLDLRRRVVDVDLPVVDVYLWPPNRLNSLSKSRE